MIFNGIAARTTFDFWEPLVPSSIIAVQLTVNGTTYTVPAGKILLLKGLHTSAAANLLLNDSTILAPSASVTYTDRFRVYYNATSILGIGSPTVLFDANFMMPIKAGGVLKASSSWVAIYGWLVDE